MIRTTDIVRAIFAPLTELTMLLPLLMFWVFIGFGVWAVAGPNPGRLIGGVLVLILCLPPLFRFQTYIVESYAHGRTPDALDAEYFNWIGSMWTMLPLFLAVLVGVASYHATTAWGAAGTWLVIILAAAVVPASLAVLAITHSALHALNPVALFNIYDRVGAPFLVAPAYTLAVTMLCVELAPLPISVGIVIGLFMMFSLASLTGALIAPFQLVEDVYIPEALEPDEDKVFGDLQKSREQVLAHAYGFISRNNRDGGFQHVICAIKEDPDPVAAWDWYLGAMFRWENTIHAQFFAQHYIRDALAHNEDVRALKVAMRCLHENAQFRPKREDFPALLEAAERTGNTELADVLKRS